jgi:amino acid adenylation domain-containing protein
LPLTEIQQLSRIPSLSRLFNIVIVFENYPVDDSVREGAVREADGLAIESVKSIERTHFPFSLMVGLGSALSFKIIFDWSRYSRQSIMRFSEHFSTLLANIAAGASSRLCDLRIVTQEERQKLLVGWNATAGDYPRDKFVHELFAAQAAQTPDAVAVVFEDQELSYGELEQRSNQLAHYLRSLGVGPEVVTGLCVERSVDLVIGLLGILKAGGAYLPLDPRHSQERLAYMLADARAPVLLTHASLQDAMPKDHARIVLMDADWTEMAKQPGTAPSSGLMPDNLAYVIYTSGSTGKPKGVGGRHAGVVNRVIAEQWFPAYSATDVCCQKASVGFIDSLFEVLAPISWGKKLVVISSAATNDAQELISELRRQQVTRLICVPSLALAMITLPEARDLLAGLDCWVLSGEACGAGLLRRLAEALPNCRFVNWYGSTEVTSDATVYGMGGQEELIPIGQPILNAQIYILDDQLEAVPIGVGGELYIGGVGLARGYLGRSALTAERFIANPFGEPGARMYRTGDLARWRADGQLECLGRIDHQVKIRGVRIEPGEIEAALCAHPSIGSAAVIAREDEAGDRRLVAYLVAKTEAAVPDGGELRTFLSRTLPDQMLPAAFVPLAVLPLTPNGKLDRRALPAPALVRDERTAFRAPQGPVEEMLASIWAEVLRLDRVGADDNFFELGGHSLLAVRLIARVRQSIGTELSLRSLFQQPTPRGLAELIAANPNRSRIPINHSSAEQATTIYLRDGSQQPIFCVHPAGGVPTVYRFIASELQVDVPMIGLQARGLDSDIEPHLTIRDMAEAYVRTICEYQQSGPIRILGWSFGGLVALEMAAILERIGRAPEQLFVLDSRLEMSADIQQMTMSDCLRVFCSIFGFDFQETSAGKTKRLLFEEMKTIKMFSDGDGIQFFERFLTNFMHSSNISQRWQPRKIDAPIAYLRCNDNPSADLEASLRRVTSGRVEIIDVDAPHYSMCSVTNSKKVAVQLDRLLAGARVERHKIFAD